MKFGRLATSSPTNNGISIEDCRDLCTFIIYKYVKSSVYLVSLRSNVNALDHISSNGGSQRLHCIGTGPHDPDLNTEFDNRF